MRIVLVCPYDWARPGGVQRHVAGLAAQLAGHDVRVVAPYSLPTPPPGPPLLAAGRPVPIPYNRSVAPVALSPLAARRALRLVHRFAPDVVHVHEPFAPVVAAAATARAPRPIVATFHAWSDHARAYRTVAPAARRLASRIDALIAVSPAAQAYAGEALGLPLGSFTVVPNGVDTDAFAATEPIAALDDGRPLLLFVGRLEPRKGLDVAIRVFLRLRADGHDLRLCIVGEGSERRRCQQLIPPALRPDVLFVGGVGETEKPRYHASADVFLAPNTGGESFGIVLLEAMAAGLPIVAADIPGFRAVLRDGRQGRLCPPNDPSAFAEAVAALLINRKLASAMAAEGRRTAGAYAWPAVAGRVTEIYARVAAGRHPGG